MTKTDKAMLKQCLRALAWQTLRLTVLLVTLALWLLVAYGIMGIDL